MQRYTEFEHTADIGVEIYGASLEELFQNAGYALFNTIVDITTIQPTVEQAIHVTGEDSETLLMNWLRELLYLFSVEEQVYGRFIIESLRQTELRAVIAGEPLNVEKHRFQTELKAVTYHQFELIQENEHWQARVIFDV